jgi:hypothetical protein
LAKAPKEKTKVIVKTSTRMSKKGPLTPDMLRKLDAYWRAANYLAAGQLYRCCGSLCAPSTSSAPWWATGVRCRAKTLSTPT